MTTEYSLLIDWLTITGEFSSLEEMIAFIGLDDCSILRDNLLPSGQQFYESGRSLRLEGKTAIGFYLGHCHNKDKGEIVLSGKGCRFFESYSNINFKQLFEKITYCITIACSRIDIAFDVKTSEFPMSRFINAYEKSYFVCKARSHSIIKSVNSKGIPGTSIYFGSRNSNTQLCIYDKASERGFTKKDFPEGWIRLELRFRRELSYIFITQMIQNNQELSSTYFGVLKNFIRFLKRDDSDTNKRRWDNSNWWDKLTDYANVVQLISPGLIYDVPKYSRNIITQTGSRVQTWFKLNPTATLEDFMKCCEWEGVKLNETQQMILRLDEEGIEWLDDST